MTVRRRLIQLRPASVPAWYGGTAAVLLIDYGRPRRLNRRRGLLTVDMLQKKQYKAVCFSSFPLRRARDENVVPNTTKKQLAIYKEGSYYTTSSFSLACFYSILHPVLSVECNAKNGASPRSFCRDDGDSMTRDSCRLFICLIKIANYHNITARYSCEPRGRNYY